MLSKDNNERGSRVTERETEADRQAEREPEETGGAVGAFDKCVRFLTACLD